MVRPFVSVVISSYNYARFLAQAIDSVLAQTYGDLELIVVDDGSTDGSAAVIRRYRDRLRPVFKQNGGHASSLNAGFAASRGDLVLFLDADDYYHPTAVERVVEAADGGAVLVQFRLTGVDVAGRPLFDFPDRLDSGDVVPRLVATGHFACVVSSGVCFRRTALSRVMPIPELVYRQAADGYLVHTVPFFGRVASISTPLGYYRIHGSSMSSMYDGPTLRVDDVRKRLAWTTRELALVKAYGEERGLRVGRLPLRCAGHVQLRLVSCKLQPDEHPFPHDAPWRLGLVGALAALRDDTRRVDRRILEAAWFGLVALSPRRLASRLIDMRMKPRLPEAADPPVIVNGVENQSLKLASTSPSARTARSSAS